jgi:hypothetical protein
VEEIEEDGDSVTNAPSRQGLGVGCPERQR